MENQTNEKDQVTNYSQGRFNRAAIKRHLKKISTVTRGGKFTRVSDSTINEIEARAEAKIRSMLNLEITSAIGGSVKPDEGVTFLTGAGKDRLVEAFANFMASEMQRFVNDTRTGSTL